MITRAQAEALLTLAESLEACEQLGVTLMPGDDFVDICFADDYQRLQDVDGMSIRLAVNALIPKQQAVKSGCRKPGCFPYCDCDSIDAPPKQET